MTLIQDRSIFLTPVSWWGYEQCFLFQNINKLFVGYFDPDFFLDIIRILDFRGDLTDNSVEQEALDMNHVQGEKLLGSD